MAATIELASLLSRDPEVKGGRLCIAGTGILVNRIAVLYDEGATTEEIVRRLYGVPSLAAVHAAVAYYLANRDAVDAEIDRDDAVLTQLASEWTSEGAATGSHGFLR
ncbi:MAG: DUF433 domain-containing protein [Dehalococcoidia bacterium]|nr:DUF433 domain-containing protein [Dehalococcoidia bacterium]